MSIGGFIDYITIWNNVHISDDDKQPREATQADVERFMRL